MKSLQRAMVPDDENGEVLRRMLDDGDDLATPREIDFFLVFAEEAQARGFAQQAGEVPDLLLSVPQVDDEGIWQVVASRHMPATHAGITALERQLTAAAAAFDGYPDGWACGPGAAGDADDADVDDATDFDGA